MTVGEVNPDSLMLRQADGQWQKFCGLLLWKLVGRDRAVNITAADIDAMTKAFDGELPTVLIHGHYDSFDLKLIAESEGHRLAVAEAKQTGHA